MLSDETTVGNYPVETVKSMAEIAYNAEKYYNYDKIYEEYGIDKTRAYNPEDKDYPSYEKYIQYITKYEHTKRLISYRQMSASMYAK